MWKSCYVGSAASWSLEHTAPNVCFSRPVEWMYLNRGRVAPGFVKRYERLCECLRSFL